LLAGNLFGHIREFILPIREELLNEGKISSFNNNLNMTEPTFISATEENKQLLRLCRSGRLYDVERWITAGKLLKAL